MYETGVSRRLETYLALALMIISAFLLIAYLAPVWTAIFPPLFILWKQRKIWIIYSLLVGIIVPFLFYIQYPVSAISHIESIVGALTGMGGLLVVIVFPFIYGVIMMASYLFWSGLYGIARRRKPAAATSQ